MNSQNLLQSSRSLLPYQHPGRLRRFLHQNSPTSISTVQLSCERNSNVTKDSLIQPRVRGQCVLLLPSFESASRKSFDEPPNQVVQRRAIDQVDPGEAELGPEVRPKASISSVDKTGSKLVFKRPLTKMSGLLVAPTTMTLDRASIPSISLSRLATSRSPSPESLPEPRVVTKASISSFGSRVRK